jgi:replicative DNA helicase
MTPDKMSNIWAEAALLGALMQANKLIDPVADILSPEHFFEPLHARIFATIVSEYSAGHNVNPVTLKGLLADDPGIKDVGGPAYLVTIMGNGAAIIGARDFARQIKDFALRRALSKGLSESLERVADAEVPLETAIAEAETSLAFAEEKTSDGLTEMSAGQAIGAALDKRDDNGSGVRCGIASLDAVLGPIKPKQLIVCAGRPGMGKTALGVSYSIGAASRGHGVLFVSLEMSAIELGERMAADVCFAGDGQGIPYAAIESGNLSRDQITTIARAKADVDSLPLQIVDIGSLTIGRLSLAVRRWSRRFAARGQALELVVVDYLQLLRPDHRPRDRIEAITEVSIGLKSIAKTHGVGVMALAQLSRKVEERPDKRPQLSDLRESGQIEQDADGILFLYRPAYYLAKEEPPQNDPRWHDWRAAMDETEAQMDFIVAKRRGRPSGVGRGYFYGAYQAVRG